MLFSSHNRNKQKIISVVRKKALLSHIGFKCQSSERLLLKPLDSLQFPFGIDKRVFFPFGTSAKAVLFFTAILTFDLSTQLLLFMLTLGTSLVRIYVMKGDVCYQFLRLESVGALCKPVRDEKQRLCYRG